MLHGRLYYSTMGTARHTCCMTLAADEVRWKWVMSNPIRQLTSASIVLSCGGHITWQNRQTGYNGWKGNSVIAEKGQSIWKDSEGFIPRALAVCFSYHTLVNTIMDTPATPVSQSDQPARCPYEQAWTSWLVSLIDILVGMTLQNDCVMTSL